MDCGVLAVRSGWLGCSLSSTRPYLAPRKVFITSTTWPDDEVSFKWYKDHNSGVKKYADYLRLHADARESAYGTFKGMYDAIVKSYTTRILPIALAPALLFWSNWYFYLIGVSGMLVVLVIYEIVRNGIRPGFYQRLVIYATLSTYANKKAKSD